MARARANRLTSAPAVLHLGPGLWVEDVASGFYGEIVRGNRTAVQLRDADGAVRTFPFYALFFDEDGNAVRLAPPASQGSEGRARSRSGSFAVEHEARVARASRIFVEGKHDAELIEQVWGHDLRVEGVVVEYLEGADHLAEVLAVAPPTRARRIGVLLDHLIEGTKEQRIADAVLAQHPAGTLAIVGHPYVDIWQAVKPARLGRSAWPVIPRGTDWKRGVCRELGWPAEDAADVARAWQRIRESVRDYRDIEPALVGRVEELIDFVTADTGEDGGPAGR